MDAAPLKRRGEKPPPVRSGLCGATACADACLADCKTCCDSRWLAPPHVHGTRFQDERPRLCPDCEHRNDREELGRRRVSMLSAIGFRNGREPLGTVESFDPSWQPQGEPREQARRALGAVKSWCLNEGPHLVVLTGPMGVGKTHLAEGAVEYLGFTRLKRAFIVAGEDFAFELGSYLGAKHDPAEPWSEYTVEENRRAYESRMRDVDYLVLDEVGIAYGKGESRNPYVASLYQRIIGWRFNNGFPTLVTGNLPDEADVEAVLGDRVASRMEDSKGSRTVDMWQMRSMRRGKQ